MSEGLNAVNFGQTTLNQIGGSLPGATSLVFATTGNMPAVPFLFQIDSEILEATALSGSTYTVAPGQEGTTPAAHANGGQISVVLTADMWQRCAPNGSEVAQTGAGLQMGRFDFNFGVTASSAGTIHLPANPVPFADYSIIDVGNNFGGNFQTISPLGVVAGTGNENGGTYTFCWLPTAASWIWKN